MNLYYQAFAFKCRCFCVAAKGIFPISLLGHQQQRDLPHLVSGACMVQVQFSSCLFQSLWFRHTLGGTIRWLLVTSFKSSLSPVSACCCSVLIDGSCTDGHFLCLGTFSMWGNIFCMPVIPVPVELSTLVASHFWMVFTEPLSPQTLCSLRSAFLSNPQTPPKLIKKIYIYFKFLYLLAALSFLSAHAPPPLSY